jgi:hypothetical protein
MTGFPDLCIEALGIPPVLLCFEKWCYLLVFSAGSLGRVKASTVRPCCGINDIISLAPSRLAGLSLFKHLVATVALSRPTPCFTLVYVPRRRSIGSVRP